MANNKKTIKQRFNEWWDKRTPSQQAGMVCGLFFVDGVLWANIFNTFKNEQRRKVTNEIMYQAGYISGKSDAYRDVALHNEQTTKKN